MSFFIIKYFFYTLFIILHSCFGAADIITGMSFYEPENPAIEPSWSPTRKPPVRVAAVIQTEPVPPAVLRKNFKRKALSADTSALHRSILLENFTRAEEILNTKRFTADQLDRPIYLIYTKYESIITALCGRLYKNSVEAYNLLCRVIIPGVNLNTPSGDEYATPLIALLRVGRPSDPFFIFALRLLIHAGAVPERRLYESEVISDELKNLVEVEYHKFLHSRVGISYPTSPGKVLPLPRYSIVHEDSSEDDKVENPTAAPSGIVGELMSLGDSAAAVAIKESGCHCCTVM